MKTKALGYVLFGVHLQPGGTLSDQHMVGHLFACYLLSIRSPLRQVLASDD